MTRRRRDHEEHEMSPLLNDNDESFTDEAGPSTGSNETLRLMVLGGDDALMDKACGTILGERQSREEFKFGICQPRTARVCGRQVSVLKTPSCWLERVQSFLFFSRKVKAIRNEIESCDTMMFPGPHAFLLVHRDVKNSGKEYYLLRALSEVFGKEVLDHCMVLFIDQAKHNQPKKNNCLKMCENRNHILYNTEDSVNELFKKIETVSKHSELSRKHLERVRAAKKYFEAAYEERESELRREFEETIENLKKEMHDIKLNAKKVTELNERIEDDLKKSKHRENELSNELENIRSRENKMKKEVQRLEEELNILNDRNNRLRNKLDAFRNQTKDFQRLNEELIIYKDTERELKDDIERLKKQIEQLEDNEKQLLKNLTEAKIKGKGEEEVQAKERKLNEREKELDDRQRILHEREKDLEIRERGVTQRDHHLQATDSPPAVSRDKIRPLDECEEQKSRDDSHASGSPGTLKPVRRNSKQ